MSIYPSTHSSIYLSIYMYVFIYPSILRICLSIPLFIHLSSISPSIHSSIYPSTLSSIHLFLPILGNGVFRKGEVCSSWLSCQECISSWRGKCENKWLWYVSCHWCWVWVLQGMWYTCDCHVTIFCSNAYIHYSAIFLQEANKIRYPGSAIIGLLRYQNLLSSCTKWLYSEYFNKHYANYTITVSHFVT